jgi:hypothetical protein
LLCCAASRWICWHGRPPSLRDRISAWREEFLAAGGEGLKVRPLPVEDFSLREAQRKVGELSMENDILKAPLEKKGHPQSPRRSA